MISIGILIYPQVEVLDFCGPFEVFRNVKHLQQSKDIEVFTVSLKDDIVNAQGLYVKPSYSFDNCPKLDILVIPGGNGGWLKDQQEYLDFVKSQYQHLEYALTVCTGALVVGKLGMLTEGMDATTHQEGMNTLVQLAPQANILPNVRFTHSDNIIMTGGISAGIDGALYLVSKRWGADVATKVARYMEYDWNIRQPNELDPSIM